MSVRTAEGWAEYHATCFAITAASDVEGVLSWARTFTAAGVPVDDLVAATDWMVLNVAPEWRREHLAHIQAFLQRLRLARLAVARQGDAQERPVFCAGCEDVGLIWVPHPKDVTGDAWGGKYEAVVACPCGKGDAQVSAWAGRNVALLTLIVYERRVPGWRDMVFRKREHEREMSFRRSEAEVADRSAGRLVRKLAAGFALPN